VDSVAGWWCEGRPRPAGAWRLGNSVYCVSEGGRAQWALPLHSLFKFLLPPPTVRLFQPLPPLKPHTHTGKGPDLAHPADAAAGVFYSANPNNAFKVRVRSRVESVWRVRAAASVAEQPAHGTAAAPRRAHVRPTLTERMEQYGGTQPAVA
jgi:hypothetical protein